MTVWLVVDAGSHSCGSYYTSEKEAQRVAKARDFGRGAQVVRAETVKPAVPMFRDEAAALLRDGTVGE